MAQANYKYQGKSNASLKHKTTHKKDAAKLPRTGNSDHSKREINAVPLRLELREFPRVKLFE